MWWFLAIGFLHEHYLFYNEYYLLKYKIMIYHYVYMYTGHIYVIIRTVIFVDGKAILASYIILCV